MSNGERQNKAGKTGSGSQRYRCMYCKIKYMPEPKARAYDESVRRKAVALYVDGMNLRRIARQLGIHHRTVSLWVKAQAANLPKPPMPEGVKEAEMDELFTFIGAKKKQIYILTLVDRRTRCFLGCQVIWERTQLAIQEMVDDAPKAKRYYSDAFDTYDRLWYHFGTYEDSLGKTDTYSVEAGNAELRHYLARLARRSRFFRAAQKL